VPTGEVSDSELSIAQCHNTDRQEVGSKQLLTFTSHRSRMCWAETWMRDSLLLGLALSDVHSEFDTPDDVDAICFSHLYPLRAHLLCHFLSCDFLLVARLSKSFGLLEVPSRLKVLLLVGAKFPNFKAPQRLTCASPLFQ
jgi:hypothetical protein